MIRTASRPTALALALLAGLVPAAAASEVRDNAGMFSAAAVREAQAILDRAERIHKVPTIVETIDTLGRDVDPKDKTAVRKAIDRLSLEKARRSGIQGVYVLIARDQSEIEARDYKGFLGKDLRASIERAFVERFRERQFDEGLIAGSTATADALAAARPAGARGAAPLVDRNVVTPDEPRPAADNRGSGMGVLLILGGVLVGIVLLSRMLGNRQPAMRRDGYPGQPLGGQDPYAGQPGGPVPYGAPQPRGGFLPGLFGGLGGAIAGNWIYDQMTGRHGHGPGHADPYGQAGNALPPDPGPLAQGGDDWGGGDGGMDWGGGDMGGGDWGGDAGGGDWG
jgi:uncharacterized protein